MERLTKRYVDDFGQKAITACGETYFEGEDGYVVVDRLASYEDLEEHGLFVKLPCKVGEKLWCIVNGKINELRVHHFDMPAFGTTDIVFRYAD